MSRRQMAAIKNSRNHTKIAHSCADNALLVNNARKGFQNVFKKCDVRLYIGKRVLYTLLYVF